MLLVLLELLQLPVLLLLLGRRRRLGVLGLPLGVLLLLGLLRFLVLLLVLLWWCLRLGNRGWGGE